MLGLGVSRRVAFYFVVGDVNGQAGRGHDAVVVSLGGGVQSTVLVLMADRGVFGPKPDAAVWADTGWEPPEVSEMVEWLGGQVSFPVVTVRSEVGLRDALAGGVDAGGGRAPRSVPMFIDGGGMTRRWCTAQHKLGPLHREFKRIAGHERRMPEGVMVEVWLGMTVDEIFRVKPSRNKWEVKRWPLIEEGMSRADCLSWWEQNRRPGWPDLARSACVACPYKSDRELLDTALAHPELMADAARVEAAVNVREAEGGFPAVFFHRSRRPLAEVTARLAEADRRQGKMFEAGDAVKSTADGGMAGNGMWGEECEGMCGV